MSYLNNTNDIYQQKYIKYKKKYLELKKNLLGSNNYLKQPIFIRKQKKKENFILNRTKLFDIVTSLQNSKEDNIKYKIVIEKQKNEIQEIKNKLKELKNIYILNDKLTLMDIKNGYGKYIK